MGLNAQKTGLSTEETQGADFGTILAVLIGFGVIGFAIYKLRKRLHVGGKSQVTTTGNRQPLSTPSSLVLGSSKQSAIRSMPTRLISDSEADTPRSHVSEDTPRTHRGPGRSLASLGAQNMSSSGGRTNAIFSANDKRRDKGARDVIGI